MIKSAAAALILRARNRAGLTQRELAAMAGTKQAAVLQIEAGQREPAVETLERLVRAAGFDIVYELRRRPIVTQAMLEWMSQPKTADERLMDAVRDLDHFRATTRQKQVRRRRGTGHITDSSHTWGIAVDWGSSAAHIPGIRPDRLFRLLHDKNIDFVLTGALAARLHGYAVLPTKVEIVPRRTPANVIRLEGILAGIDAKVFCNEVPEGLPVAWEKIRIRAPVWRLVTSLGRVEASFARPGTGHHDELAARAKNFAVFGVRINAASVEDLMSPLDITGSLRNSSCSAQVSAIKQSLGRGE